MYDWKFVIEINIDWNSRLSDKIIGSVFYLKWLIAKEGLISNSTLFIDS